MSHSGSNKRKPAPAVRSSMLQHTAALPASQSTAVGRRVGIGYPTPPDSPTPENSELDNSASGEEDGASNHGGNSPESVHSGQWVASNARRPSIPMSQADVEAYRSGRTSEARPAVSPTAVRRAREHPAYESSSTLEIDWIMDPEATSEAEEAWRSASAKMGRIKSVGRAPRHRTPDPTPTHSAFSRGSVVVEKIDMPMDAVERIRDSHQASEFTRKDSDVLGDEDAEKIDIPIDAVERIVDSQQTLALTRKDSGVLGDEDAEYVRRSRFLRR